MTEEKETRIRNKLLITEANKEIEVRVEDTDLMGVVHANNYFNYFDDGFASLMSNLNKETAGFVRKKIVFPIRKAILEYENSARFGDVVVVRSKVKKVGTTSITLSMECYRKSNNQLLVKGECVRVIMDMNENKLLNIIEFFSDI